MNSSVRRKKLRSPMQRAVVKICRLFDLGSANALEVFGREGDWHTMDYADKVASLDVWEINPKHLARLRRNLPTANVKITDSFEEVRRSRRKFDLIVVDNPQSTYGKDNAYCEHFELFPHIFRIAKSPCILILDVNVEPYDLHEHSSWWERRKEFYGTAHPEKLSLAFIKRHYEKLCLRNGFESEWSFHEKRNEFIYYFVCKIRRTRD